MKVDQVKELLAANGFQLDEEKDIPYGKQLRFTNGSVVNVFDKGTVTPQGKDVELVKEVLGLSPGSKHGGSTQAVAPGTNNKVFVVYGHQQQARTSLDAMLRRWGLEPLILDQLPSEGKTIIEKLENGVCQRSCPVFSSDFLLRGAV